MKKVIQIATAQVTMEGMLHVPKKAHALVLFAHGSGSSRFSPRNNFVADVLYEGGLATLLIDLLSKQEDAVYEKRFDIDLLTERLDLVVQGLKKVEETKNLSLGLFGSSTGAAAALRLAAKLGAAVHSVVSRGGRPDLAMDVLDQVSAPTLFIVGGADFGVIELNQQAYDKLACEKQFAIVPNATHLFEEAGCLEEVARLAKEWFKRHFLLPKRA